MASGTTGATSTYSEGKGFSFAKNIASRIVDAAEAAKKEKKHQQKIIADGGTVPEKDKKNLFVKALKQEFISNPVNDLKKSFNKKVDKVGRFVGLFGSKGEKLQEKLGGKKFKTKTGFDRSRYQYAEDDSDNSGGSGVGGAGLVGSFGELVLDIQQIASQISSIQGLITTQMNMSLKMSDSLEQIKSILTEQISLQQEQLNDDEMAARETALESSQQTSGSSKATSTFNDPAMAGLDILAMFGQLSNLFNIIKSLPSMFMGLLKGIVSKIPGGKFLIQKFGGGAAKKVTGEAAEAGAKGLLGKMLRPIFKRIPIIGGLIDFAVSLALGEPVGRAAAKAAGAMLGGALGGLVGSILPGPGTFVGGLLGGIAGDWVGGGLYDAISGAFGGDKEKKMAQGGGVMVADAGPELVTGLHSADAKKKLGGMNNKGIDAVQDTYYSALAGSTLAITKDFVEGLGPVGSAVAPVIQDEVSKLGRDFDLPATTTKVSVGGMGLRGDPQAAKKGQNFLQELVKGTLEKLTGKKDKDKTKTSSGSTSSGDSSSPSPSPSPSPNTPTGGGKSDLTFGDSIASGLVGRQGANQQTVMDASGVSKVGASPADVLGQLQSFDKSKLKGKVVRLSSGITNNPSDLKSVEEQIKYLISVGAKVQLVGVTNTPPKTGAYKHLEKPLTGMNDKLSALASKYKDKGVSFLGGFTPGTDGIHPSNASELNTKFNVDVLPGGQVGAAAGYSGSIRYFSSNDGRVNKPLVAGQTYSFNDTKWHHGAPVGQGKNAKRPYGWPRDYTLLTGPDLSAPNAPIPTPLDGTIVEKNPSPGGGYGNHVVIDTSIGKMLFAHFSRFGNIKQGEKVSAGTILGVQGNTPGGMADHLHIDAPEAGHEAFINFITSGKAVHGGTSSGEDEEGTETDGEPEVDPFTAIEKAVSGILTGAAMMSPDAKFNTKEDADKAQKEFEEVFKIQPATTSGANPTATANKPSTTPTSSQPAAGGGMNGGRSSTPPTPPQRTSVTSIPTGMPTSPSEGLAAASRAGDGVTADVLRPKWGV